MTDIVMKASSCHPPSRPRSSRRPRRTALPRLLSLSFSLSVSLSSSFSSGHVRFKTLPELRAKGQRAKRKNRIHMRSHLSRSSSSSSIVQHSCADLIRDCCEGSLIASLIIERDLKMSLRWNSVSERNVDLNSFYSNVAAFCSRPPCFVTLFFSGKTPLGRSCITFKGGTRKRGGGSLTITGTLL